MVLSQVVIVKFDQGLDGFLHRAQLDESHFSVFPKKKKDLTLFLDSERKIMTTSVELKFAVSYWKNLKALTTAPELRNKPLRWSSVTEGLQREDISVK